MTAGNVPRPWISGSATTVARMLPVEQPLLTRQAFVSAHLNTNELDVLRDIFPVQDHSETPTYTSYNAARNFSSQLCTSMLHPPMNFCLETCSHTKNRLEGMLLHHFLVFSGLDNNFSVCDQLARMYGRCDAHHDAFYCFDNMGDRSTYVWSYMIALHLEQKQDEKTVVQLFRNSLNCNALPDASIFLILLSSCKTNEALGRGKQVHVLVKSMSLEMDVALGTALLSMYSRCENFSETWMLFDNISEKSVVTWNAMITACVQHDNAKEAVHLFIRMQQEGLLPNIVTFVSAISASAREVDLQMGKSLHVQALSRGLESDISLAAAFVSMYGKCGSVDNACSVFREVHVPCVVLWTGMLTVYCQHGYMKEMICIYRRMQEIGILPNEVTFLCLVSACTSNDSVSVGKLVHAQITSSGIKLSIAMSTALAVMYGRLGLTEESDRMFSSSIEKSTITWNAMMQLMCGKSAQSNKGIQLFSDMLQQGVSPDKFTFVNVLHACPCLLSPFEGIKVHMHLLMTECRLDMVVCNALIDMYSKCKLLSLGQKVFDGMHLRNTISWNTLMTAYVQSGHHEKALSLFSRMQVENFCTDAVTFSSVLSALAQRGSLSDCWKAHTEIIQKGFDLDVVVATTMITVYGRYGSLTSARLVFDRVCERDDNIWSSFIIMLGQHDSPPQAFQLLDDMRNQGFIPSISALVSCLSTCPGSYALAKLKQIHVSMYDLGVEVDETEVCVLMCAYAEWGDLSNTWSLFTSRKCNSMLCNSMIGALGGHGKGIKAFELFKKMEIWGGLPDEVTFLNLLSACNHSGLEEDAFGFVMSRSSLSNLPPLAVYHYDCVVDLLGRVGRLNETMLLIAHMPFKPTSVTWTSLLGSCTNVSDIQGGESAANHLLELSQEGFVPFISLLRMYAKLENFEEDLQARL